ncbi:MAG: hypothetical protein ACTSP4_02405 [Candidatus Hodarchaeales archaeon]
MSARDKYSGLTNVFTIFLAVIICSFSIFVYVYSPPSIMRDFILVLGMGFGILIAAYIFLAKNIITRKIL